MVYFFNRNTLALLKFGLIIVLSSMVLTFTAAQRRDSLGCRFSGYFDFFYGYDFNKPTSAVRLPFLVSHNRHNLMGLNLAMAGVELGNKNWRAKATLQTGSFADDNYETPTDRKFRFVQEAYAGFSLNRKNNLWIDIGVFPSHIGYESAIAADNWCAGRSLASELTPYFLSGAKIAYRKNSVQFSGLLLNGWNRIFSNNSSPIPSLGTQFNVQLNSNTLLSWNTMLGNVKYNTASELRFYNNLFLNWKATEKDQFIVSFDIGYQDGAKPISQDKIWMTSSLVYQRRLFDRWNAAFRGEYFRDDFEAVTRAVNGVAFNMAGISCNLDYNFGDGALLRFEGRVLRSPSPYFQNGTDVLRKNMMLMVSLNKKF